MSSQLDNPQVVKNAIKRCLDFVEQFAKKNLNINGNRVTNAGDGVADSDYATVGQLKRSVSVPTDTSQIRTILWSNGGVPSGDLEWYLFGLDLDSKPLELWVVVDIPPSSATMTIDLEYGSENDLSPSSIMNTVLSLDIGNIQNTSSSFNTVSFAQGGRIRPVITETGDAAVVSIGLVVQRT